MGADKIAVVGPSGQGKSTLLRILSLLELYDDGEIYLEGVCQRIGSLRNGGRRSVMWHSSLSCWRVL